jgi:tRNA threonylcarbamoyladenosine biosynthesis protein TsaB
VHLLALDTCDARGSVAVLCEGRVLAAAPHPRGEDYSSWLLPAVDSLLSANGLNHANLVGYAVAAGPGSFTGVRLGLTTVKAWSEAFGKPVVSVSRLKAIADCCEKSAEWVAPFFDGQRGQVFGGLYRASADELELVGEEMVAPPEAFVSWVAERTEGRGVVWASLDPGAVQSSAAWRARAERGESVGEVSPLLAPTIGKLGRRLLALGRVTDPLQLDANYVRRSDAELFWKRTTAT